MSMKMNSDSDDVYLGFSELVSLLRMTKSMKSPTCLDILLGAYFDTVVIQKIADVILSGGYPKKFIHFGWLAGFRPLKNT